MDNSETNQRKNFRCVFNPYVNKDNRDGIVQSVIAQFQGYGTDPEVTVHDDGFILTLNVSPELPASAIRDKILWNKFIERVTTQDAIRKIQIIRLPKTEAGLMDFGRTPGEGSIGGFGPEVDPIVGDTGVNEKLNVPSTKPQKYKIDGGQDPKILGETASAKLADQTDLISEDQNFVPGLTPADLSSKVTDMSEHADEDTELDSGKHKNIPKVFMGFRRIAIDSDMGANLSPRTFNGLTDVEEAPPGTGITGDAPISGASWYVYQPGNAQGTELGVERNRYRDHSESPFGNISQSSKKEEPEVEDEISSVDLPQSRGGGQAIPDGGQVRDWFGANKLFGLNETYDYKGDFNDYDI